MSLIKSFLNILQLWCSLYNEQMGKTIVAQSVHSLPDLRYAATRRKRSIHLTDYPVVSLYSTPSFTKHDLSLHILKHLILIYLILSNPIIYCYTLSYSVTPYSNLSYILFCSVLPCFPTYCLLCCDIRHSAYAFLDLTTGRFPLQRFWSRGHSA